MNRKVNLSRRWIHYATFFSVAGLLVGACATPYRKLKGGGGYSDYRIADDIFAVNFRGNAVTREEVVEKYLLRRACELTLEHGYKHFVVLAEKRRTRSGSIGYSGVKVPIITPGEAIQIRCFHEPPEDELALNAADFLRFNFQDEYEDLPPPEADDGRRTPFSADKYNEADQTNEDDEPDADDADDD